jgi:hypothetical protein
MIQQRRKRAYAPDPDAPDQICDAPECTLPGEYKAPKSRSEIREFHWFCLEHVREFNSSWDYYKGMSPAEIEAQLRADASWQRPTWPLGQLGHSPRFEAAFEDHLHAFNFGSRPMSPRAVEDPPPELRDALGVLGLIWPVSFSDVKAKYKQLAKRHHPDANGGDRDSEEILKSINLAYATLRGKFPTQLAHPSRPAAE